MIHQYKLNGYNIVLDVYSGSIHIMSSKGRAGCSRRMCTGIGIMI